GCAVLGRLDDAEGILLLISASYLAADDAGVEMERARERGKRVRAVVVPILLQPCDFEAERFAKLQMLPRDGTPVTSWPTRSPFRFLPPDKGRKRPPGLSRRTRKNISLPYRRDGADHNSNRCKCRLPLAESKY